MGFSIFRSTFLEHMSYSFHFIQERGSDRERDGDSSIWTHVYYMWRSEDSRWEPPLLWLCGFLWQNSSHQACLKSTFTCSTITMFWIVFKNTLKDYRLQGLIAPFPIKSYGWWEQVALDKHSTHDCCDASSCLYLCVCLFALSTTPPRGLEGRSSMLYLLHSRGLCSPLVLADVIITWHVI